MERSNTTDSANLSSSWAASGALAFGSLVSGNLTSGNLTSGPLTPGNLASGSLASSLLPQSLCQNATSSTLADTAKEQTDALLYIVVVLGVYSFGVVLMVVMYLKEEKRDLEEEILLENFVRSKPMTVSEERSRISGRLAMCAFNAANLVTQPRTQAGKITFV